MLSLSLFLAASFQSLSVVVFGFVFSLVCASLVFHRHWRGMCCGATLASPVIPLDGPGAVYPLSRSFFGVVGGTRSRRRQLHVFMRAIAAGWVGGWQGMRPGTGVAERCALFSLRVYVEEFAFAS